MIEKITRRRRRPVAELNLVPYIDVMLVLLIIFMITAPNLQQGIEVNLPEVDASESPVKESLPLIATVSAQGRYFLEDVRKTQGPMDLETMKDRVSSHLKAHPNTQVMIKGDARVDYGRVVHLMAELQGLGLHSIGLMTQLPEP